MGLETALLDEAERDAVLARCTEVVAAGAIPALVQLCGSPEGPLPELAPGVLPGSDCARRCLQMFGAPETVMCRLTEKKWQLYAYCKIKDVFAVLC